MSDEIERLREFAAEYQKITGEPAEPILRKISALEAAADPWREAKKSIDHWRSCGMWPDITGLYDHLSAENARLEKRVKELEKELGYTPTVLKRIAELEDVKDVADMQPEFEGPIVGLEPILDPARVLATAAGIMEKQGWIMTTKTREDLMGNVQPYRVKGVDE